ncbi:ferredoxin oxidoreductase|uniref:2-oxoglutarate ferredoxin oxidoreductase subunit alpha n=1 Tax=Dendrosporobacter quercicolus TaxID=146817 RepID=A0A1G9N5A6_9FIRM|nr:ferredoxin oxidoreductase [Dendrosporobacter quercicolus]NSL47236.1 ferredoxin oxidoreductase [Dendrosporobacter quercicolus DSM 1736]SDL81699.1 2-oxoglutarate ferredoxin oxidoreductase subunit alpha [Dendrosporobacter quercicolus]
MAEVSLQGERRVFMTGNEVIAWAAVAAKAEIMYGYPITPQNEIMHYWTRLAPKYEKKFLQTEDEISAGFTTLGGVFTGTKAFTATSGPGNVLMQESAGMAEMMRLPVVYIIQQRGGPSTATVIYGQQETTLTCFGGNGEGYRIVYSPATHQDLFDYTIKAFDVAWTYRFPTFVLGDGYQAKMREPLTIYDPESRGLKLVNPEPIVADLGNPGRKAKHLRNCLNTEDELYEILQGHQADFDALADKLPEWDEQGCGDAEIIIISHGVVSRAALGAYQKLREEGRRVGYFRPITLRPFPEKQLKQAIQGAGKLFLAESAYGQLLKIVQNNIYGSTLEITPMLRPGVGITSEEIYAEVSKL